MKKTVEHCTRWGDGSERGGGVDGGSGKDGNPEGGEKPTLTDIAYSLSCSQEDRPTQYVIVTNGIDEALVCMEAALEGHEHKDVYRHRSLDGAVAFLFPGQGSQRTGMAADLFASFPSARRLLDAHPSHEPILFPPPATDPAEKKAQRAAITDTRHAQPLLGLVDHAIAELLEGFGVEADMVAGHSYGELPALCFAGVLAPDDLLPLSRRRAESILAAIGPDPGRMAAVRADRATLHALLQDADAVWAANLNAPQQTVVAGTSEGMAAFLNTLSDQGISASELNVACAFHSPLLASAEGLFAKVLEDVSLGEARLPVWSNTTAELYPTTPEGIKQRLAEHLVKPVRFAEELEQMYEEGARIFIETGPGCVLTGLAAQTFEGRDVALITTERNNTQGLTYLLHALAHYASLNRPLNYPRLFEGRAPRQLW
jgi:acyl transferase domain-containing protein